jgi:hypothetical protein
VFPWFADPVYDLTFERAFRRVTYEMIIDGIVGERLHAAHANWMGIGPSTSQSAGRAGEASARAGWPSSAPVASGI